MSFCLEKYYAPDFEKEEFINAPDALMVESPKDGVAPDNYHAMSIFPEYFKIDGKWLLAAESRMDCVPVYENGKIEVKEFRNLKKGELVICGRTENCEDGIYVNANGFRGDTKLSETFAFRQGHSRESSFSRDYDELYELLNHERDNGKIVWVMGPAFAFDHDARDAFAYLQTALGQNIYTQKNQPNGHYNHLDTINKVRYYGSVSEFIKNENINNGIIYNCEKYGVPYVLAGSIRDDGPLPCVFGNAYEAQDNMRNQIRSATTVICMATTLHSIAVGNMTPSFRVMPDGTVRKIYFYCVDISEFTVNKLTDRGSLSSIGIVTNVQDFIVNIANGLKV